MTLRDINSLKALNLASDKTGSQTQGRLIPEPELFYFHSSSIALS